MKGIKVMINGVEYPCRPTMGAMTRFKEETGKEITEISVTSVSDMCVFLYCCVASASAADKVDFNFTFREFADLMDAEMLAQWQKDLLKQKDASTEK